MSNIREMSEQDFISLLKTVYEESILRYGSLQKAMVIADLAKSPNQVYSNEQIYEQLRKVELENGFVNQAIYNMSKSKPTSYAIVSRFGTFENACNIAKVKFIPNPRK
ncbi:hypothetical protein [Paenibacillus donghaensis]|uniref:Uncharacterized protein n=1 Tax=Paenibacillus donghaensis TaxID=414771 RepID=A0A2Z2KFV7_9BACL|nr:hypothetical protein [Paenibacillus donghaensis]ASA22063.1 hypothetical protein B9T62_15540 [Paenibacillus donghaensis]